MKKVHIDGLPGLTAQGKKGADGLRGCMTFCNSNNKAKFDMNNTYSIGVIIDDGVSFVTFPSNNVQPYIGDYVVDVTSMGTRLYTVNSIIDMPSLILSSKDEDTDITQLFANMIAPNTYINFEYDEIYSAIYDFLQHTQESSDNNYDFTKIKVFQLKHIDSWNFNDYVDDQSSLSVYAKALSYVKTPWQGAYTPYYVNKDVTYMSLPTHPFSYVDTNATSKSFGQLLIDGKDDVSCGMFNYYNNVLKYNYDSSFYLTSTTDFNKIFDASISHINVSPAVVFSPYTELTSDKDEQQNNNIDQDDSVIYLDNTFIIINEYAKYDQSVFTDTNGNQLLKYFSKYSLEDGSEVLSTDLAGNYIPNGNFVLDTDTSEDASTPFINLVSTHYEYFKNYETYNKDAFKDLLSYKSTSTSYYTISKASIYKQNDITENYLYENPKSSYNKSAYYKKILKLSLIDSLTNENFKDPISLSNKTFNFNLSLDFGEHLFSHYDKIDTEYTVSHTFSTSLNDKNYEIETTTSDLLIYHTPPKGYINDSISEIVDDMIFDGDVNLNIPFKIIDKSSTDDNISYANSNSFKILLVNFLIAPATKTGEKLSIGDPVAFSYFINLLLPRPCKDEVSPFIKMVEEVFHQGIELDESLSYVDTSLGSISNEFANLLVNSICGILPTKQYTVDELKASKGAKSYDAWYNELMINNDYKDIINNFKNSQIKIENIDETNYDYKQFCSLLDESFFNTSISKQATANVTLSNDLLQFSILLYIPIQNNVPNIKDCHIISCDSCFTNDYNINGAENDGVTFDYNKPSLLVLNDCNNNILIESDVKYADTTAQEVLGAQNINNVSGISSNDKSAASITYGILSAGNNNGNADSKVRGTEYKSNLTDGVIPTIECNNIDIENIVNKLNEIRKVANTIIDIVEFEQANIDNIKEPITSSNHYLDSLNMKIPWIVISNNVFFSLNKYNKKFNLLKDERSEKNICPRYGKYIYIISNKETEFESYNTKYSFSDTLKDRVKFASTNITFDTLSSSGLKEGNIRAISKNADYVSCDGGHIYIGSNDRNHITNIAPHYIISPGEFDNYDTLQGYSSNNSPAATSTPKQSFSSNALWAGTNNLNSSNKFIIGKNPIKAEVISIHQLNCVLELLNTLNPDFRKYKFGKEEYTQTDANGELKKLNAIVLCEDTSNNSVIRLNINDKTNPNDHNNKILNAIKLFNEKIVNEHECAYYEKIRLTTNVKVKNLEYNANDEFIKIPIYVYDGKDLSSVASPDGNIMGYSYNSALAKMTLDFVDKTKLSFVDDMFFNNSTVMLNNYNVMKVGDPNSEISDNDIDFSITARILPRNYDIAEHVKSNIVGKIIPKSLIALKLNNSDKYTFESAILSNFFLNKNSLITLLGEYKNQLDNNASTYTFNTYSFDKNSEVVKHIANIYEKWSKDRAYLDDTGETKIFNYAFDIKILQNGQLNHAAFTVKQRGLMFYKSDVPINKLPLTDEDLNLTEDNEGLNRDLTSLENKKMNLLSSYRTSNKFNIEPIYHVILQFVVSSRLSESAKKNIKIVAELSKPEDAFIKNVESCVDDKWNLELYGEGSHIDTMSDSELLKLELNKFFKTLHSKNDIIPSNQVYTNVNYLDNDRLQFNENFKTASIFTKGYGSLEERSTFYKSKGLDNIKSIFNDSSHGGIYNPKGLIKNYDYSLSFDDETIFPCTLLIKDFNVDWPDDNNFVSAVAIPRSLYNDCEVKFYAYIRTSLSTIKKVLLGVSKYDDLYDNVVNNQ